jgi:hypothetical protein
LFELVIPNQLNQGVPKKNFSVMETPSAQEREEKTMKNAIAHPLSENGGIMPTQFC